MAIQHNCSVVLACTCASKANLLALTMTKDAWASGQKSQQCLVPVDRAPEVDGSSWPLLICSDLLSQAWSKSSLRPFVSLGLACEWWNLNAAGVPLEVTDTFHNARATSTHTHYSGKCQWEWCKDRGTITMQCSVVEVLCFLQELLEKR